MQKAAFIKPHVACRAQCCDVVILCDWKYGRRRELAVQQALTMVVECTDCSSSQPCLLTAACVSYYVRTHLIVCTVCGRVLAENCTLGTI
jgi:hypothetical protein